MDIKTNKLEQMERELESLLNDINMKKEAPKRVLNLLNVSPVNYAEAWDSLSFLDIITPHVEALLNNVKRGDLKRVGSFISFALYHLERFGEKDPAQTVVYSAQREVMDIFSKFQKRYFIA